MNPLAAAGWWALDYLYAGWRQLAALFLRRPPARWSRDAAVTVVLLPGVYESWGFVKPLGEALSRAGHRVLVSDGLGYNRRTIAEAADVVAGALERDHEIVLVGHSKGGLIGKHLLVDAAPGVRGLVAVATPFAGARRARFFRDPVVRALLPGDETIVMLGSAASVNARIVSVFGTFDPHVPDGSALDGATNVRVPVAGHFRILGARATHRAVIDAVARLRASP